MTARQREEEEERSSGVERLGEREEGKTTYREKKGRHHYFEGRE